MTESGQWDERFFGCFDDIGICLCGAFCGSCLFGQNAKKIDGSNCFLWCCAYGCLVGCHLCGIPHYFKRQALREKYGLPEDRTCNDILTAFVCSLCANCQEARFLKRQGSQSVETPHTTQPRRPY